MSLIVDNMFDYGIPRRFPHQILFCGAVPGLRSLFLPLVRPTPLFYLLKYGPSNVLPLAVILGGIGLSFVPQKAGRKTGKLKYAG